MADASDSSVGAVLRQENNHVLEPFGIFSRKLSNAEMKFSAYDRELLARYLAVKYFRKFLEGRPIINH